MKKITIAFVFLLSIGLLSFGPIQTEAAAALPKDIVINTGKKYIGTPYKWGGTTPRGFDCSGFVSYTYKQATGKSLPRSSSSMYRQGRPVAKTQLQKGDLVYFNTSGKGISHVAIYIGGNQVIHSVSKGVKVDSLSNSYWKKRYVGAKRI